jgi:hypothetical protein
MTELEDDIRAVLQDRAGAGAGPDNPARTVAVRAQVRTIRRRRTATTAACLAVAVGAALGLSGLAGGQQPPTGVPGPPYFTGNQVGAAGYPSTILQAELSGPQDLDLSVTDYRSLLLVVRCGQAGVLRISTAPGQRLDVPCRTRIEDAYQGALQLAGATAFGLFGPPARASGRAAHLDPGSPDRWQFGMLAAALPDRLSPLTEQPLVPLLEGPQHPAGGSFPLFVPPLGPRGAVALFSILVECVQGVRLTLRVPRGVLAVAACEPAQALNGLVYVGVPVRRSAALGLRGGATVTLSVEASGRHTDQWRVVKLLF